VRCHDDPRAGRLAPALRVAVISLAGAVVPGALHVVVVAKLTFVHTRP